MATITIPKNAGRFCVRKARAGNYMVQNDRTGKNQVTIPCDSLSRAEDLCQRLNAGDHNGQVHAPSPR